MLRILESQAPAKQNATDTINTLSSRLASATLLEDRRAAILGLRSFAKSYPASVASGALRDLIAALRRDGEDSDTVKIVLETLLMLFEPDEKSLEASEEITLWLADEFTQRQDNITALLDLLDTGEFYLRLYSLQILSHICAARPQRTHEAVLAAPLGVSRITAVLDEKREAVRNEALLLLVSLTPTSAELQKVVAFENAFDRVFALIESEGGLTHGSTAVRDCLSLLANLLTLNTSNQSYFREIGCVARVSRLLANTIQNEESPDGVAEWTRPQRDMNLWGLLAIVQLFLLRGSQGIVISQTTFWQQRILHRVLQVAFHQSFGNNVRAKSLETCGDIIRGNSTLQEQFGDLAVPLLRPQSVPATNGHASPAPSNQKSGPTTPAPTSTQPVNVIEALLGLTLEPASLSMFDLRLAACNCMKSFLADHNGIRGHVLRRAIEGHSSGEDAIPNMLTVLLEPSGVKQNSDPYQVWMAGVLLVHILNENPEAKSLALTVSEGDAEEGEEVVTFVQSLTSNVVAGVQHVEDERALIGYLMLLSTWLFEDPEAVNDLLGEGSTIQGLAAAVKISSATMPLVAGLCAFLLGIIYEFSTRDSPIPRATLHGVIQKHLGRELYIDRLTRLRESPFVRDFEVLPPNGDGPLPDVFFDKTFVDFLKDNFSRLLRAIDRDPSYEASIVSNGVQKGISRELVDTLRAELEEQKRAVESAQAEMIQLRAKFEQGELEHRRTRESASVELSRIKAINEHLQRNHEEELQQVETELQQQRNNLAKAQENVLAQMKREHLSAIEEINQRHKAEKTAWEQRQKGHEREITRAKENLASEHLAELSRVKETAEREHQAGIQQVKSQADQDIGQVQSQLNILQNQLREAQTQLSSAQASHDTLLEDSKNALDSRIKDLTQTHSSEIQTLKQNHTTELNSHTSHAANLDARVKRVEATLATEKKSFESQLKSLQSKIDELEPLVQKQKDTQTELDDLLVVFADLEAKREEDKKRLKALGESVSEDEDEDDAGEDGEQEEEADDDGADEDGEVE